jgi:transcriptional regulator with XRE-family HTH domain
MPRLRTLVRRALLVASPSIEQLAKTLGYSTSALRRWRLGNREVPVEAVTRLAKMLRRQARDLERAAAELDRHAEGATDADER